MGGGFFDSGDTMNISRRSFTKLLGLAPVAAALPAVAEEGAVTLWADRIEMNGELVVAGHASAIVDMGTTIPADCRNCTISVGL